MTTAQFDYFVVLAAMRTGSNFLEANLNQLEGISCHGEAFNPSFIGYPQNDNVLGVTLDEREECPERLIAAIKGTSELSGFRLFNDHDPRALKICLDDPRCAKIILTRNPLDSFISWQIAKATGQWKLTNPTHAKSQKVAFEPEVFDAHLKAMHEFRSHLRSTLQKSGQTAFTLDYEDLNDAQVINGISAFLGSEAEVSSINRKLKKQNPEPISEKVTNFEEMQTHLQQMDSFGLGRTPDFEPRRGPNIPTYIAAARSDLLFMPIRSGPVQTITDWMAALDGVEPDDLLRKFSQKTLRQWKRTRPGHVSFTVLRHPVARAHSAFCTHILFEGPRCFGKLRETLRKVHKLPLPEKPTKPKTLSGYDIAAHRKAFYAFLVFLKHNLSAQTSVRVDPAWATQLSLLQAIAEFNLPDMILREDRLDEDLALLGERCGKKAMTKPNPPSNQHTDLLHLIYDKRIEAACRDAYQRDYMAFGFGPWIAP